MKAPNPGIAQAQAQSSHGTRSRYKQGCHCDRCRAADTAYHNRLNARKRAIVKQARQAQLDAALAERTLARLDGPQAAEGPSPAEVTAGLRDLVRQAQAARRKPVQAAPQRPRTAQPEPARTAAPVTQPQTAPAASGWRGASPAPVCGICGAPAVYLAGPVARCMPHQFK